MRYTGMISFELDDLNAIMFFHIVIKKTEIITADMFKKAEPHKPLLNKSATLGASFPQS